MPLKQIKDKLSECFKNHKPVLLYNDTSDNRNDIILTTHTNNGGNLNNVQYIGSKNEQTFLEDVVKEHNELERNWLAKYGKTRRDSIDHKGFHNIDYRGIHNKVKESFKSTEKCYKYLDCKGKNGKTVQQLLMNGRVWRSISIPPADFPTKKIVQSIPSGKSVHQHFHVDRQPVLIQESYLLDFRGTLFIDNLECNNKSNEEVAYYCELADVIKENKVNWLVVYVHNIGNFPERFLGRFEPISLDGNKIVVEPVKERVKTEVGQQEGKGKDNFVDVKLKMVVDWKGSYSNSHYEVSVTCNNPLDNEFNLAFRFMPVLYLLVKGVNENTTCVRNKELKNAYNPDEAKKEIIKAFTRVIGRRAKKIIKIEHGIGKKLMIPRKNITLKLQKSIV